MTILKENIPTWQEAEEIARKYVSEGVQAFWKPDTQYDTEGSCETFYTVFQE